MTATIADIAFENSVSQFGRRVDRWLADGIEYRDAVTLTLVSATKSLGMSTAVAVKVEWARRRQEDQLREMPRRTATAVRNGDIF